MSDNTEEHQYLHVCVAQTHSIREQTTNFVLNCGLTAVSGVPQGSEEEVTVNIKHHEVVW